MNGYSILNLGFALKMKSHLDHFTCGVFLKLLAYSFALLCNSVYVLRIVVPWEGRCYMLRRPCWSLLCLWTVWSGSALSYLNLSC